MEIKLTLTLEEVNLVLAALGKQPHEVVAGLWGKIRSEAQKQVNEQEETKQPKDEKAKN